MTLIRVRVLIMLGCAVRILNAGAYCHEEFHQESQATARASSEQESDILNETVEGTLRVGSEPGKFYYLHSGKAVPQGGLIQFEFRLKNDSDMVFEFDKIRIGCKCLTVKCNQKLINPGDVLEVLIKYHSPKSRSLKYGFTVNFMNENQQVGYINIGGALDFTLAIQDSGLYESNGSISQWKIPVLTSAPVDPTRLKVSLDESLGDLVGEILIEEGKAFVQVTGPESALGISGISGTIKVNDPVLSLEATALGTFVKAPVIRLSPLYSRFVELKERPGWYSANFLVQAVERKRKEGGDVATARPVTPNQITSIKCSSEPKYDIQVDTKKLNEKLYRIDVLVKRTSEDLENFQLKWQVESIEGELVVDCDCYFLENMK